MGGIAAVGTVVGKMAAVLMGPGKSRLSHPHSSQLDFAVIFPKPSEERSFGKDHRKLKENLSDAQNAVEN